MVREDPTENRGLCVLFICNINDWNGYDSSKFSSNDLYPMLARRHREEALIKTLKSYLLILGAFAAAAYFGFDL